MLKQLKKNKWFGNIAILFISLPNLYVNAQELPERQPDLETVLEEIFAVQDQDLNYDDLYESLWQRYQYPLNLNIATLEDLRSLFMLSERQISNLLRYREVYGNLLTIYELQVVPAWDEATIQEVLPFVTVAPYLEGKPPWQQRWRQADKIWLTRTELALEEKKGYTPADSLSNGDLSARYAGAPYKVYSRFRISRPKDFSVGFTADNDAGELWQWNIKQKQYGPDFLSAHAYVENEKKLKRLAIGDYTLQWGQGLLFGSGFIIGKGGETVRTVSRASAGVRPYTSVLESGFLRGAASTYGFLVNEKGGMLDVTAFYARQQQDGNVPEWRVTDDSLNNDPDAFYSSLLQTGLHRTPSEISAKNQLTEQTTGANLLFKSANRNLQLGLTVAHTQYDIPIRKSDRPYNRFEFSGDQNYVGGLFADYVWKNTRFFGEVAQSKSGGVGGIGGFTSPVANWMEFAFLMRYYDKDFHSFYGNAFGENSRNINEQGVYWGVKLYPFKYTTFSAYFDKFSFPWLKYRIDAPSEGYEYLARLTYAPTSYATLYAQYREEQKGTNVSQDDEMLKLNIVLQGRKRGYWLGLHYKPNHFLYLKSRVQFSSYALNDTQTTGYALAQDAGLHFQKLNIHTSMVLFDADYNNRQYVYERDVLYAFSVPAYQGKGIRTYLLVQYNFNRTFSVWGRITRTRFTDRNTISSGLETIEGNSKTDLKFQLRIRF